MTQQFSRGDEVRYTGHKKRTGPGHGARGVVTRKARRRTFGEKGSKYVNLYRVDFGELCPECGQSVTHKVHPNYLEHL